MPTPPPTAMSEAMAPIAPDIFSRGNSSRMMPKASGSAPPPMPWMARAMIITITLVASAASSEPAASAPSVTTKTRFLQTTSPIRPMIGVKTDADSRYAVSTPVTVF
jgi:hypothetical protein